MTRTTEPTTDPQASGDAAGHLAGLRKMSTTAGVGLGEYRAVNGLSVASLVLGIASWMAWLHPLLYLIPAAAVLLGLLGLWQIRTSHGTQGGTVLAGAGLALALVMGSLALVADVRQYRRVEAHRAEIAQVVEQFGEALARSDYEGAYALTSENFRREVSVERFSEFMAGVESTSGGIRGASENRRAQVEEDASGVALANAMLLLDIGREEPVRESVLLVREPEGWRFLEFTQWFPRGRR